MDNELLKKIDYIVQYQEFNYKVIEELYNVVNKQSLLLDQVAKITDMQSISLNEINKNLQSLIFKLSDMEIKNSVTDDYIRDIEQNISSLIADINILTYAVENIKVFKMVDNHY